GFAIGHIIYRDSPYFKLLNTKQKFKDFLTCELKKVFFKKNSDVLIFETIDAMKRFQNISKFKKNYVVSNTINEIFLEKMKWQPIHLENKNKKKILVVTANYPHKNLKIIPSIIDKLVREKKINDFEFVITVDKKELGFGDYYDNYIQYIGKVPLDQLPSLYNQSTIVFMPTLLEIFSATYLEAMYMSKAIVASDMGFSRDICEDAAFYCSPTNIDNYVDAIDQLLKNIELRTKFEKKGFSRIKSFGTSLDRTNEYLSIMKYVSEEFKK
ncbi:TPA: glycosyltransferase family 1 protein, partial [Acinetobacter baumannii]|nr:glycosyltransferase family 1 protein [Acinetobacter baumannii]